MSTTRIACHIKAPPERVYRALISAEDVQTWMVPAGMTSEVHTFEPREGGAFRISLTYDDGSGAGKSSEHTDTHHGRFVKLVPNELVVQTTEFETSDPALQGEMTMTISLKAADGGTDLVAVHENAPPGVKPEDNEMGWRSSLDSLAALVEGRV